MPITQYVNRRYLSEISSRANDRVQDIILHKDHGEKGPILYLSAAPSKIYSIKVVLFSYEYHKIKPLVHVKAKTVVETLFDNENYREQKTNV